MTLLSVWRRPPAHQATDATAWARPCDTSPFPALCFRFLLVFPYVDVRLAAAHVMRTLDGVDTRNISSLLPPAWRDGRF